MVHRTSTQGSEREPGRQQPNCLSLPLPLTSSQNKQKSLAGYRTTALFLLRCSIPVPRLSSLCASQTASYPGRNYLICYCRIQEVNTTAAWPPNSIPHHQIWVFSCCSQLKSIALQKGSEWHWCSLPNSRTSLTQYLW